MKLHAVSLDQVLQSFSDLWSPRIVAQCNDFDVRVARFDGTYIWHSHDDTDEFFLVLEGELILEYRAAAGAGRVVVPAGSCVVVPRSIEHRPSTTRATQVMLLERTGTVTTGDRNEGIPAGVIVTAGQPARR